MGVRTFVPLLLVFHLATGVPGANTPIITRDAIARAIAASAPQQAAAGWDRVVAIRSGQLVALVLSDDSVPSGVFVKADQSSLTTRIHDFVRNTPRANIKEVRLRTTHVRSGIVAGIAIMGIGAAVALTGAGGGPEPAPTPRRIAGGVLVVLGAVVGGVSSTRPAPVTDEVVYRAPAHASGFPGWTQK